MDITKKCTKNKLKTKILIAFRKHFINKSKNKFRINIKIWYNYKGIIIPINQIGGDNKWIIQLL